ncbi:Rad60-SLD_2 domain-containing protein [Trichoderma simmonsii]|uniref:Rad60-SLD_2 domain-containing protein n=1 Tax=Trichoderma simmonsii TaxID=1491479 RepID=A0A8G0PBY6_9HYPO|nr:Rad60-SLD_2 domain-containing protein [Trichoderma simmonsii]
MSAPTDSTTNGGSAAPGNGSGLEQPTDAVQLNNIAQTSEADEKPGDEATTDVAKDTLVVATPSAEPVSTNQSTDQGETSTADSSSKGKQIDNAPEPATESEALKVEQDKKDDIVQQEVVKQDAPKDVSPKEDSPKEEKSQEDQIEESVMAIGPAEEEIKPAGSGPDGPVCNITLLLASGGRHPYKIDAKYLSRRHVDMPDKDDNGNPDPFSISIYTLKELILREWRSDWEAKPASPSSIRLIHFGKLLDDKEQLKKYQFSSDSPNVVHMSIRPQDLDEEEPKSGGKSLPAGTTDGDRVREGRCCVIL